MIKNHERFNNISSGIQSIIFSMAIITGGVWTLITFSTLKSKNKAEAELSEIQTRIEKQKSELFKQAIVDIQLEAKQESGGKDGYVISAVAKITNKGNTNANLDFSKDPISVYEIHFDENGNSEKNKIQSQNESTLTSTVLRNGSSMDLPFYIKLFHKGFYIIEYSIPLDSTDVLIDNITRGKQQTGLYWIGTTHIPVK